MSRWLAWILAVGTTVPLIAPAALTAQENTDVWYQRAEALIRDLEAGRFGAAERRISPQVVSQLDSARLATAWGQITAAAGMLQSLSRKQAVMQGEMQVVEMDAAFQRQTLLARVVMQADGQVIGLWFLPPESGGPGRSLPESRWSGAAAERADTGAAGRS